jgi:hypothetical protein
MYWQTANVVSGAEDLSKTLFASTKYDHEVFVVLISYFSVD